MRGVGPKSADICPKPARRDRSDGAIEELSRRQHHVLTIAQLESVGLSARGVRHRAASGRLHRLHRGVYAVGRPSVEGRWLAAVLACGEAALSHHSAAELWNLATRRPGPIDVIVPTRAGRTRDGIRVHRGELLPDLEATVHNAIPCTTPARTLLDLAATTDHRSLERAIDRAEGLRLFDLGALTTLLDRHTGRAGTRALRSLLDRYTVPAITESAAEERFLSLVRAAGLPEPEVNRTISLDDGAVYRPDFMWRAANLIVEIDGRTYHARRSAFERDRVRDRRLALAGFETRRYAASELVAEPRRVVCELQAFLRIRSSRADNGRNTSASGPGSADLMRRA